jgi:hypothetical protein
MGVDEILQGLYPALFGLASEFDFDWQNAKRSFENHINFRAISCSKVVIVPIYSFGGLNAFNDFLEDESLERGTDMRVDQELVPCGNALQEMAQTAVSKIAFRHFDY